MRKKNNARRGPLLKKARLDAGFTIEQLALRVGCGVSTISEIETGSSRGSATVLHNLAMALGLETADVIAGVNKKRAKRGAGRS